MESTHRWTQEPMRRDPAAGNAAPAASGPRTSILLSPLITHLSGCHLAAILRYPRDTSASVASSSTPRML